MVNWLVIGAISLIVVVTLAVWQVSGGGSDSGGSDARVEGQPDKGATGGAIVCPGGETITSTLQQSEEAFEVVGTLSAVDGRQFTIDAPTGPMEMVLAFDSEVEGEYALGDAMKVGGRFTEEGRVEALDVAPACGAYVASVEVAPATETPTDVPVATPAVVEPTAEPKDTDDDEENGNGNNRGHRNNEGNGGNRGNNANKDDDDHGDD